MRKTTKKHKYFKKKGLDGHKRYDTKIIPTLLYFYMAPWAQVKA